MWFGVEGIFGVESGGGGTCFVAGDVVCGGCDDAVGVGVAGGDVGVWILGLFLWS